VTDVVDVTEVMMGRLSDLPVERFDPAQRALYDSIVNGRRSAAQGRSVSLTNRDGSIVGPFGAYLRAPTVGACLSQLGEALRFDTSLPRNLLELAVITVARHWTAQFEWYAHSRFALEAGVSPEVVSAIAERRDPSFADPAEAHVHRFARVLLEEHRVDDETYREAVLRLGETQVVELTALIGYYGLVSGVLNAFEVPLPAGADPLPA
jgi:4-carboxymuconolactone decarboxylase